jgi:cytochrome bd ubiquinol oxidase subunit II
VTLEIIWYLVIVVAMICYAMLDGFDLGVGLLHPFIKGDAERRVALNAIGPVWDGNEVWLVIVAGALFAGFPEVFATVFSTFYIPTMLLLMGLIFRAVSIEFRSKRASNAWRSTWDYLFFLGSLIIAFGVGVVLGNLIHGLPLDENHNFTGTFADFVNPFDLLVGVMTVALFTMHGAIFLVMKTEGEMHDKLRSWVPRCIAFFVIMYLIVSIVTVTTRPYMIARMQHYPLLFLVPALALGAIFAVPFLMRKKQDGWAFICSSLSIALLLSLAAIGTYPYMVRSTVNTQTNSLVIFNSASSALTLKVLLIIVAIGLPLVFAYGFYVYRVFRGKVQIDSTSY